MAVTVGRRTIFIQEPLWREAQRAAAHEAVAEGRPVSTSEVIRRALAAWLEKREQWDGAQS